MVSGVIADSMPPFKLGGIFLNFDGDGEVVYSNTLLSDDTSFGMWGKDLYRTQDGAYLVTGHGWDDAGELGFLVKYDAFGDVQLINSYVHPYFPEEDFIGNRSGMINTTAGYAIAFNVSNTISEPGSNDLYLVLLNDSLETTWSSIIETPQRDDAPTSLTSANNKIYIGAQRSNQNLTNQNYTSQLYIQVRDTSGQLLDWRLYPWDEDEFLMGPADAMYVEEDGALVVATRECQLLQGTSVDQLLFRNKIIMFDSGLNEIMWETSLNKGHWSSVNSLSKVVKANDNSGYIISGQEYLAGEGLYGLLGKVSLTGDSLWLRHYEFVTSENPRHYIYDMEQTPDGGYIMVGEARPYNALDPDFPPPIQQGWILKVDEYGCLVPGCQTVSTTEASVIHAQLTIYPNPATDYLNVFFHRQSNSRELWQFRLLDTMGKVYSNFQTELPEMTFILEVQHLPSGIYFLEAIGPEGQRETVEVMVQR